MPTTFLNMLFTFVGGVLSSGQNRPEGTAISALMCQPPSHHMTPYALATSTMPRSNENDVPTALLRRRGRPTLDRNSILQAQQNTIAAGLALVYSSPVTGASVPRRLLLHDQRSSRTAPSMPAPPAVTVLLDCQSLPELASLPIFVAKIFPMDIDSLPPTPATPSTSNLNMQGSVFIRRASLQKKRDASHLEPASNHDLAAVFCIAAKVLSRFLSAKNRIPYSTNRSSEGLKTSSEHGVW